jgi:Lon protease-like protein
MSHAPDFPGSFSGVVRLFPLPNLVLFPYVVQPLHVFEPRYRQMLADALADDRLLAMALLKPGWEEDYHKAPPIHPVVCVGRVFKEERLPDGRYNLLLHGLARAALVEEIPGDKLYRSARARLVEEVSAPEASEQGLRRHLGEQIGRWFAGQSAARAQLRKLLESALPLGTLCDVLTFALPVGVALKQELLEEPRVRERVGRLLAHLESAAPPQPSQPEQRLFPPGFSAN